MSADCSRSRRGSQRALQSSTRSAPAIDLELVPEMSIVELRALWAAHMTGSPPALRRLLIRDLAWRVQERVHGGLDRETQRLLRKAIRRLRAANTRAARSGAPTAAGASNASVPALADSPRPAPGAGARAAPGAGAGRLRACKVRGARRPLDLPTSARLVRTYKGVRHEVTVLGQREFKYAGKTYASLSKVAHVITGNHWSGPVFFGLARRTTASIGAHDGVDQPGGEV